ncbi:uncharacterized protein N7473_012364 [Penicillium subrubescens]|uniref:uncharacterized protein n=1 Tax=Penicillium subrubescens TaxID=1316194 RepID=UPI0025456A8B|nr:uncharacterized protein N7473_012364 [Penicillium subrubescens]KAJ5881311.1 hypothetical protein N7473_012364 [Penicillium subrubescens]
MGNSGSTISDLFYLDNPKRRRRAEELKGDIHVLQAEFSGLKAHKIIWDIIGLVGVVTVAIIGLGYAFSIVTASQALAATSALGGIIGIAAVIVLVFKAVEGALERQKLRDAIHALWPKRAEMKLQVELMRAITNWVDDIETWLRFPEIKDTKMMNDLLAKTLNADYNRWTSKEVARALKDMDNSRNSWANEDPTSTDISIVEEVPTAILELLQPQTSGKMILDCGSYGQAFQM